MIQYLTHSYLVGSFCVYDSMNADRMGERGGGAVQYLESFEA